MTSRPTRRATRVVRRFTWPYYAPVGKPVEQRVQHGDPAITYLRDVVTDGRGRLLRHSVSEGEVADVAEYVNRSSGSEDKSGRVVQQLLGALVEFLTAPGRPLRV